MENFSDRNLVAALLGSGLKAIWSGLDETQQAAVAEAVHDPLGEYSEQRFRARYPRVPAFRVAGGQVAFGYGAVVGDVGKVGVAAGGAMLCFLFTA